MCRALLLTHPHPPTLTHSPPTTRIHDDGNNDGGSDGQQHGGQHGVVVNTASEDNDTVMMVVDPGRVVHQVAGALSRGPFWSLPVTLHLQYVVVDCCGWLC